MAIASRILTVTHIGNPFDDDYWALFKAERPGATEPIKLPSSGPRLQEDAPARHPMEYKYVVYHICKHCIPHLNLYCAKCLCKQRSEREREREGQRDRRGQRERLVDKCTGTCDHMPVYAKMLPNICTGSCASRCNNSDRRYAMICTAACLHTFANTRSHVHQRQPL